jgi:flagellar assembly protein FliH
VVVRVPDAYYDALDAEIPALAKRSGFEGKVVLLSEPSLQPGDLRVEWADGGAEREVASLAAEIDAVLCRASAPEPSETTDPTDDAGASEVPDETSPAPPPEAAAEPQEG